MLRIVYQIQKSIIVFKFKIILQILSLPFLKIFIVSQFCENLVKQTCLLVFKFDKNVNIFIYYIGTCIQIFVFEYN